MNEESGSGRKWSCPYWGTTPVFVEVSEEKHKKICLIIFFNWLNTSRRIVSLWSTQLLTEMSTRNLSGVIGRPARKADNLTAICEPIVYKNVGASSVCHRDSLPLPE
jgi:hypothetical protein